jgi:hypothetical protein
MLTKSSSSRMAQSLPSMRAALGASKPFMTHGTMCLCWPESQAQRRQMFAACVNLAAMRNGAPFKDWVLPAGIEQIRRKLRGSDDGDRQMVQILSAVLSDGLAAVDAACSEAIDQGAASAPVVLNILARAKDSAPIKTIFTPQALQLSLPPMADCQRYDQHRKAS